MKISSTAATLSLLIASSNALVPQVPMCDYEGCPVVSQIGLGTLHLGDRIGGISDAASVNAWLLNGLEKGITLYDTADVYPPVGGTPGDSATLLGEAMAMTPGLRENITIVCKMDIITFPPSLDSSAKHLTETVNWFLDKLQTNYLDIVLLHFPDSFMNATEVALTFNQFKESGQVKYFGTSNHYPSQRKVLQSKLTPYGIQLVTNEVEVSVWNPRYLNYNSNEVVNDAILEGYRNLAWGALGGNPLGGFNRLFGRKGLRQERILHALKKVGKELGEADDTVVALAWLLSHSANFIPLIGTTQIDRVNNLVRSFDYVQSFTSTMWWEIARAGGICFLADVECDYHEYRGAHEYLPDIIARFTGRNETEEDTPSLN